MIRLKIHLCLAPLGKKKYSFKDIKIAGQIYELKIYVATLLHLVFKG